jgi:hypothetical protein
MTKMIKPKYNFIVKENKKDNKENYPIVVYCATIELFNKANKELNKDDYKNIILFVKYESHLDLYIVFNICYDIKEVIEYLKYVLDKTIK